MAGDAELCRGARIRTAIRKLGPPTPSSHPSFLLSLPLTPNPTHKHQCDAVKLWDVRSLKSPLRQYRGHVAANNTKPLKKLFKPVFARHGARLVTSGQGTHHLTVPPP